LAAFASCNSATNEGMSEAQVDSMVNARVEEIRLEMMAQNDSLINAMAQMKADSIIAAMKGGGGTKTTTKKTNTTKPNEHTIGADGNLNNAGQTKGTTNPKDSRFNGQNTTNTDKKESRFNQDAAQRQQDANTKKKEDRFK